MWATFHAQLCATSSSCDPWNGCGHHERYAAGHGPRYVTDYEELCLSCVCDPSPAVSGLKTSRSLLRFVVLRSVGDIAWCVWQDRCYHQWRIEASQPTRSRFSHSLNFMDISRSINVDTFNWRPLCSSKLIMRVCVILRIRTFVISRSFEWWRWHCISRWRIHPHAIRANHKNLSHAFSVIESQRRFIFNYPLFRSWPEKLDVILLIGRHPAVPRWFNVPWWNKEKYRNKLQSPIELLGCLFDALLFYGSLCSGSTSCLRVENRKQYNHPVRNCITCCASRRHWLWPES